MMRQMKGRELITLKTVNITLLLLGSAGISLFILHNILRLQRWLDAEAYTPSEINAVLDEIALKQLQEYAQDGKVSSKLYINSHCYDHGETKFLKSSNSIVNVIRGRECRLGFIGGSMFTEDSRAERIFIFDSSRESVKKVVRVSCKGRYLQGGLATEDKAMPQLFVKGKPSCPPGSQTEPEYDEYVIWEGKVLNPTVQIRQIAQQQFQEFFETQIISSELSFENDCLKGWTEFSDSNDRVNNIITAKDCFGLNLQSYIHQIIPDSSVSWSDYEHESKRWQSASISAEEITCKGNYELAHTQEALIADLSKAPPGQPYVYGGWCPHDVKGESISPKYREHQFELEDEPIDPSLPAPPPLPSEQ